ncbi:MAG TPA: hypothetical protein VK131_01305 [Candidatus Acidoferrales bacterium]|nr:hypothetical protein [Candidatus Acidoferrales bacterium]
MDDYQKEIRELEAQIDALVEEEGDARTIAELGMQLEILKALYARARDLFGEGERDQEMRHSLAIRGYGEWTLENVYAFVYEQAVDLEPSAHAGFVAGIRRADFASLLAV